MKRTTTRNKPVCYVLFAMTLSIAGVGSAQVRREWVARYNGPANFDDFARATAVDAAGNVYVTGDICTLVEDPGGKKYPFCGDSDYATIKYDVYGNERWVARYHGSLIPVDVAYAIAVDAAGNVYVTGSSGRDHATIKYDTNGNQLWVARYNGRFVNDIASAIALDAAGNAYVTGLSGDGYATIKYDTDGNELWVVRYIGAWGVAPAIALDAAGNAYVTGSSWGHYVTIKYDTDGNELWVARYSGPANLVDVATAIAVDTAGNVYVTGWSDGIGTLTDYATIKYDTNGNELWVARYNGPGNADDAARAIAFDAAGSVYVTGSSFAGATLFTSNYATIKYDSDGNELWVARYNNWRADGATAIALDTAGNVYVTGWSESFTTSEDYATIKYDTDGNQLWVERYNGPANSDDSASAIAVDAAGSVYVTGASRGVGTRLDYATVKYSQVP